MKSLVTVFILLVAFPEASYSNQPLPKRVKTKKIVKINKTDFEFGAFKFVSPVLAKKSIFIG
jgi:hypothetical protein